jgi:aarF domain-containing kinase
MLRIVPVFRKLAAFRKLTAPPAHGRLLTAEASANTASSSRPSYGRVVGGSLALTTLGGFAYIFHELGGAEGISRSISFYSLAIPKYIEYRWRQSHGYIITHGQSPDDHAWDDLDRETSKLGLAKILELRGFYIKSGQLCAANIGNAFPPIWRDTMSVLQDQVPAQPFPVIRDIVARELDFDKTFQSFETEPIGAASIGQVHRAVLRDGRRVVVKVCYPNVERLLRGDVRTIKLFARLAQPVHVPSLEEVEEQFSREFDYRQEAQNLELVRNNLQKGGLLGTICQVPKPYLDLCTKNVLVMEELFGDKLAIALTRDLANQAERNGLSVEQFMESVKAKAAIGEGKVPSTVGPTSNEYDLYIRVLDTKRRLHNAWSRIHNMTLGLVGAKKRDYDDKSKLPMNHAKLLDDLIYIHGHEVLIDGRFNADPHPGNILVCRGANGSPQLGLIDYGQVKVLDTKEMRHLLAKIIIALDDDDRSEVVRLMKKAGFKSKKMDPDVIWLYAKVGYDEDNAELTGGKHIQMFMEDIEARDPIIELPKDFIMVSRCTMMLRGLCHAMLQSRSIAKSWRPIAERVLREDI